MLSFDCCSTEALLLSFCSPNMFTPHCSANWVNQHLLRPVLYFFLNVLLIRPNAARHSPTFGRCVEHCTDLHYSSKLPAIHPLGKKKPLSSTINKAMMVFNNKHEQMLHKQNKKSLELMGGVMRSAASAPVEQWLIWTSLFNLLIRQ